MEIWQISHRADPQVVPLADRHYNRQHIGSPQFAPPGRCLVLDVPYLFGAELEYETYVLPSNIEVLQTIDKGDRHEH